MLKIALGDENFTLHHIHCFETANWVWICGQSSSNHKDHRIRQRTIWIRNKDWEGPLLSVLTCSPWHGYVPFSRRKTFVLPKYFEQLWSYFWDCRPTTNSLTSIGLFLHDQGSWGLIPILTCAPSCRVVVTLNMETLPHSRTNKNPKSKVNRKHKDKGSEQAREQPGNLLHESR